MRLFPHGSNAFPERSRDFLAESIGIVVVVAFLIIVMVIGWNAQDRRDPYMSGAALEAGRWRD